MAGSQQGRALKYASAELQGSEAVVQAAVLQDQSALMFASAKIQQDYYETQMRSDVAMWTSREIRTCTDCGAPARAPYSCCGGVKCKNDPDRRPT